MGYKFLFVTLAGFHSLNHGMFELSQAYAKRGMAAYSELQQVCQLPAVCLSTPYRSCPWAACSMCQQCGGC